MPQLRISYLYSFCAFDTSHVQDVPPSQAPLTGRLHRPPQTERCEAIDRATERFPVQRRHNTPTDPIAIVRRKAASPKHTDRRFLILSSAPLIPVWPRPKPR